MGYRNNSLNLFGNIRKSNRLKSKTKKSISLGLVIKRTQSLGKILSEFAGRMLFLSSRSLQARHNPCIYEPLLDHK